MEDEETKIFDEFFQDASKNFNNDDKAHINQQLIS